MDRDCTRRDHTHIFLPRNNFCHTFLVACTRLYNPGRWSLVIPQWMLQMSSNFMTLFLSTFATSHWSHFSKKNFENLKNGNFFFRPFRLQRVPPLKFFFSKLFFSIFLVTNHIFSTWIWILLVLSFLLKYITWVLVKIFTFLL